MAWARVQRKGGRGVGALMLARVCARTQARTQTGTQAYKHKRMRTRAMCRRARPAVYGANDARGCRVTIATFVAWVAYMNAYTRPLLPSA